MNKIIRKSCFYKFSLKKKPRKSDISTVNTQHCRCLEQNRAHIRNGNCCTKKQNNLCCYSPI